MSTRRKPNRTRRPASAQGGRGVDVWQAAEPLAELEPIAMPDRPSTLLASLGDPPLANAGAVAGYFAAVSERAAAVATALALSADQLAAPDDERPRD